MPKIVKKDALQEAIARAVWTVIRTKGSSGLSVRTIAKQANMPVSTLRHYFPSQSELLLFSMNLIAEQVRLRLRTMPKMSSHEAVLRYVLHQFLPLDGTRQREMEVWLYFVSEAVHNEPMRRIRARLQAEILELFAALLRDRKDSYLAKHADYEAQRLQALVDGLALRYLAMPSAVTRREIVDVLDRHLAILTPQKERH